MASAVPANEPRTLHTAKMIPAIQRICPEGIKKNIAEILVATFTNLADAEAFKKSKAKTFTKRNSRKLPVPGPKIPS